MTWNEIETNWPQFAPLVRRHWFRLTEGDLAEADGRHDFLARRIADRYDLAQADAEREVDAWAWLVKFPAASQRAPTLPPARPLAVLHRILDAARAG
jgi:uncharacterized protein YjbJ (UPF0337 family)